MSGKQCRNGRLFVGARRVGDIREVIDVSQVVRLGDTEETDGGPLRLDTNEELCALETRLTRESDA